jgi:hypothetical protein
MMIGQRGGGMRAIMNALRHRTSESSIDNDASLVMELFPAHRYIRFG